ncbi:pectinesterase family protein [Catenovulum agarivorans]|uniref:pectinesterase family protein n=1 Tax=Catenovulum agarivorans TaxID=1172192 RepID=UPI00031561A0|nr:pectinesterase family protein [Catenovulum agarivorans]
MKFNYKLTTLSSVIGATLLSGCGFDQEINVVEPPAPALTGQFVDSAVSGISYIRTNVNGEVTTGVTNSNGEFEFFRGDTIVFHIGDLQLPAIPPKNFVTPLSFFKTDNSNAANVANLARLLQSLDDDGDPSNGINIFSSAAGFAKAKTDPEGNALSPDDFFALSPEEFAQSVEEWLPSASNNTRMKMVSYDDALDHFVKNLSNQFGKYKEQAFDPAILTGDITNIFAEKGVAVTQVISLTPADETNTSGTYVVKQDDVEVEAGNYVLHASRQVITFNKEENGEVVDSNYLISLSKGSGGDVYSLCHRNIADITADSGLYTLINACETVDNRKENKFVLNADLLAEEFAAVQEYAENSNIPEPALSEDFSASSVDEFYSSNYKRLAESTTSGALYYKTGGTIELVNETLVLAGDRFSIGNTTPDVGTTGVDTKYSGIYNISKGFTISFDVIDHNGSGSLNLYVDNNTTSSGSSIHGGASKFVGSSINDENFPKGQRFTYTAVEGDFPADATNSFFQLRTDSAGSITIDNLVIETNADAVEDTTYHPKQFSCAETTGLYFCDDFSSETLDNWDIYAASDNTTGPVGAFDVLTTSDGNKAMRFTADTAGGVLATVKDSVMANVPSADYFVEMKIRPRQNSKTSSKHLYMLGRYVDNDNWYAGGLNMQNAVTSTQAEIATNIAASLSRPVQKKQPFVLGEKDATDDGIWYTVRFEMLGDALTLYIDGENKGTYNDTTFTAKGLVGLYTNNRSFEIDDVKIGDANVKPVQLTADYSEPSWVGSAGGSELVINLTAVNRDGTDDSGVQVYSSDEDVATVSINGSVVTITPLAEGDATIHIVSGSDETIYRELAVNVGPSFIDSTTDYGDLTTKLTPVIDDASAYVDTTLSIEFDSAPQLGTAGIVRIFDKDTGDVAAEMKVGFDALVLGANIDKQRTLLYKSIDVVGNKLVLKPQVGSLDYNKSYYVVVGNDVVVNTKLNGIDFDGLGSSTAWEFTTQAQAPTGTTVVVDDDGTDADFRTLQGALDYVMSDKDTPMTISIKDGTYDEFLYLRNKHNLTIEGESRDGTIVQGENFDGLNGGSSGRPLFLVEGSDMLQLRNFTLKNTHIRTGSGDQAETIYFNSPGRRLIAEDMNFISEQDTLQLKGYVWIYNSLVAGNVDFIWGYPEAALFEKSEIRTIGDSKSAPDDTSGGYVLQARVQDDKYPGFVFLNSEFTSGPGPLGNGVLDNSTYIARSAGNDSYFDNVVLINNKLGAHINSEGWATKASTSDAQPDPNPAFATASTGWREYGSMDLQGNALDTSGRDMASLTLSGTEAGNYYTRTAVFKDYNGGEGWDPQPTTVSQYVFSCADVTDLYFCDDFSAGNLDNWDIQATDGNTSGPEGVFDVVDLNGNMAMRYTAGGLGGVLATVKDSALANVPDGDYFVEARIRPRNNSTTSNKQLYLLGRLVDNFNWYGGGLNVQGSPTSTQVEVAKMLNGADHKTDVNRPVQSKRQIVMGEKGAVDDGVWYKVRFEMKGSDLSVYFNGELIGTAQDTSLTAKGLVGIFTYNRSFEMDDLKVGNPDNKPAQLTLDYVEQTWVSTEGDTPLEINATALKSDRTTADTFTVESSNPFIASATVDGSKITVTPVSQGNVTLTITSDSDPSLEYTIEVEVKPSFIDSATSYGNLSAKLSPMPAAAAQYTDSTLSIEFDSAPTLGVAGQVRIYEVGSDTLVDTIKLDPETDVIGTTSTNRTPKVRSILVEGNTLIIKPHSGALQYNTDYYVVVGDDVATNVQLNGVDFDGLGSSSGWTFSTRSAQPVASDTDITVDDDGYNADYRTVQAALNHAMALDKDTPVTITVREGTYREILFLKDKNNVTIQGESRDNSIVAFENYEGLNSGSERVLFLASNVDNLVLNNFTLKNTHERSGSSDQAETIYFQGSGRLIANNMNFISEQDTLLLNGYVWIYNSLVAGNVDFIWGAPVAALFENSEIRTIGRSEKAPSASDGGYILQARVNDASHPGFVFINNDFTNGPGPQGNGILDNSTYIARSGGGDYFDNIVLINNTFGSHIITSGWKTDPTPNPAVATATSGWREFGSKDTNGAALDLSSREANISLELTANEADVYSDRAKVFASYDSGNGWNPQPIAAPVIVDDAVTGDGGFAGENGPVTGGAGGDVVTVDNGKDLVAALATAKSAGMPVTIYVKGTITPANTDNATRSINIKDIDDVSIIGVGTEGEFDGIGLQIERANNIIIRNLKIHDVPKSFGDAIGIQSDQGQDDTSRIWIDHNELHGSLNVGQDDYDGLIDTRYNAKNITISYNYIHDHHKTMLNGSDDKDEEKGDRFITWHHNYIANIVSRAPLFRYGFGHIYNNYFHNITGSAINSRMGAELLVENNVFENVKNPIISKDSAQKGYWNVRGNEFVSVTYSPTSSFDLTKETSFEIEGQSTSTYEVTYDYADHLMDASKVKDHVLANAGIGKIDQSGDTIPAIGDNGSTGGGDTGGTPNGVITEDFSAADTATFVSATYKSLPGDTSSPLYARQSTTETKVGISNGELLLSNSRITVGRKEGYKDTTAKGVDPAGSLDLSNGVTVSFKLVSISLDPSETKKEDEKYFQLYIDNNTGSSSSSIHDSASRFMNGSVAALKLQVGQTLTFDTDVGTANSFIQLRAESNVIVVVDDLVITPK